MTKIGEYLASLPHKTSSFLKLYLIGALYSVRELCWRTKLDYSDFPIPETSKGLAPLAVITGGCGEIGLEVAKKLVGLGFEVLLIGKDKDAGKAAIRELQSLFRNPKVSFVRADLSSRTQLKKLSRFVKRKYTTIHLLINNAGTMLNPYEESFDGYEMHFAVNYLAHAYLSLEWLPLLEKSGENDENWTPRIVEVTSATLFAGNLRHFIDENFSIKHPHHGSIFKEAQETQEARYSSHGAYADSKLASAAFFSALQARLSGIGSRVSVASLHPGVIPTQLYRHVWSPYRFLILNFPGPYVLRTKSDAADDVVYIGLNPQVEEGQYFEHGRRADISWLYDPDDGEELWEKTLRLCGMGPKYFS